MPPVVYVLGYYIVVDSDGIAPHYYQLKEILPKTKNEKNNKKAYHSVLKDKLFYHFSQEDSFLKEREVSRWEMNWLRTRDGKKPS
jgi:hypothetical protein